MAAVIALVLIAIVALAVVSFTVHFLSPPGCWWPSPSWPGSGSSRATQSQTDVADSDVKAAREPPNWRHAQVGGHAN
jgi:hypothetical protein